MQHKIVVLRGYTLDMSWVEEIKAAIEQLTPEGRCELVALLSPAEEDAWDKQMKKDSEPGGKLHPLMEAANNEYEQGASLPFPKPVSLPAKAN